MIDLGSFEGTFGQVEALNNRGEVAGLMNLPGDVNAHPFFWARGWLIDLGMFGGFLNPVRWTCVCPGAITGNTFDELKA